MIGLVADDTLCLKTDALSEPESSAAGCVPFEYAENGVSMTMAYASAPIEVFDDPEVAKIWASRAHEAARRSRGKATKRPRRTG